MSLLRHMVTVTTQQHVLPGSRKMAAGPEVPLSCRHMAMGCQQWKHLMLWKRHAYGIALPWRIFGLFYRTGWLLDRCIWMPTIQTAA